MPSVSGVEAGHRQEGVGEAAVAGEPGGGVGGEHPAACAAPRPCRRGRSRRAGASPRARRRRPAPASPRTMRTTSRRACTSRPAVASSSSSRRGPVQQRAGDLGAALLAAGQPRDPAAHAARRGRPARATSAARVRASARGQAVQRRVVGEVLRDRQVGVERPALEHHAHLGERRPGRAAQVVAEDLDAAGDVVVEPGDQREQRGLAGAVHPEQRHELARAPRSATRRRAPSPARRRG